MTGEAEAAFERMRTLWEQERQAHRRRHAEERAQLSLSERVRRGLALRDLEVVDTDAAPGGRAVLWIQPRGDVDLEVVRIGPGDPVRLWWDDPDEDDAVRGVVSRRTRDRLAVMVDEAPERGDDGFRLDVEAPEATFDRGAKALARWRELEKKDARSPLRDVLFGGAPALFAEPESLALMDEELNEPQRRAVTRALAAETVSLIHGPPGTGKTRCLVEVVRQLVARGERVLVSAASNLAVDNLAERLADHGAPVLRLGHPARVSPSVEAHTLDALLEKTPEHQLARRWTREAVALRRKARARFERGQIGHRARREAFGEAGRLMRDARAQLRSAETLLLARHPIVCATAAGADAALLRKTHFDHVVLDEATQATDPIALVALWRAARVTMAGDPRQLPPTVIDPDAERGGLGTTFFERLSDEGSATTMLEVQHRMHEVLMRFPSEQLYEGKLRAHEAVAQHGLGDLGVADDPLRPGPLVFLDTAGKGWTERRAVDDPSTDNPGAAARVIAEARRLLSRGLADADLAIITPYLAQARLLRDGLSDRLTEGLEIGTVDGFQGREKEAVIVDLVRSNEDAEIGFLADVRRMNVAMTRAKRLLLVVGDSATLARHPFYDAFMAYAEAHGTWLSAWSDEAEPLEPASGRTS
ncbi:MAG: AAA domain-containing protein [Sandaracinaceae bacterium]